MASLDRRATDPIPLLSIESARWEELESADGATGERRAVEWVRILNLGRLTLEDTSDSVWRLKWRLAPDGRPRWVGFAVVPHLVLAPVQLPEMRNELLSFIGLFNAYACLCHRAPPEDLRIAYQLSVSRCADLIVESLSKCGNVRQVLYLLAGYAGTRGCGELAEKLARLYHEVSLLCPICGAFQKNLSLDEQNGELQLYKGTAETGEIYERVVLAPPLDGIPVPKQENDGRSPNSTIQCQTNAREWLTKLACSSRVPFLGDTIERMYTCRISCQACGTEFIPTAAWIA